ncbi:hypothetical protein VTK73DRAFT_5924 [Phialemonium thermophilum]|uniref:Uncharacterized protein n=1 Tax=Phialemonium thermophilum TaxID=223376 RepID=A0ABR3WL54_9PEZI
MAPEGTQARLARLLVAEREDIGRLALEPLVQSAIRELERLLHVHLDEELADRIEDGHREGGQESGYYGKDDPRVVRDPVPDMVRLDALLVREAQLRSVLAASERLRNGETVQAVPGHDGVPHESKVEQGVLRENLGVGRLRGNLGDLAVPPEETVQRLL